MYTFWDKFVALCVKNKESATKAATNMGFSRATASGWKHGKKPNDTTIQIVCDYFNVDRSYFEPCNGEEKPYKFDLQTFASDGFTEQEKTLIELFRSLDEIDKAELIVTARDLSRSKG